MWEAQFRVIPSEASVSNKTRKSKSETSLIQSNLLAHDIQTKGAEKRAEKWSNCKKQRLAWNEKEPENRQMIRLANNGGEAGEREFKLFTNGESTSWT